MAKTRRCPFYGCSTMIDPELFACRHHWPTLDDDDRCEVWAIYSAYLKGDMHIDQLVEKQSLIMLKNTPQLVPGSAKGPSPQMIEFANAVERYLKLRREYTATKDGYVEAKRRVGMALGKQETVVAKLAKAILHPEQKQPTLFDEEKKPDQLPD